METITHNEPIVTDAPAGPASSASAPFVSKMVPIEVEAPAMPIEGYVKMILKDDSEYVVKKQIMFMSGTIKQMFTVPDRQQDDIIHDARVNKEEFERILNYCTFHVNDREHDKETIKKWDEEFVKDMTDTQKIMLIDASDYFDVRQLFNFICKVVGTEMRKCTPEECRARYHIKNENTPEVDAELMREHGWLLKNN
jgi:hypothetical protein